MTARVNVYEPVAPCLTEPQQTRRSLAALTGKIVGFIDNSKPNFEHLVDDLSDVLVRKHGVSSVIKRRKRSASQGASETVMNELAEQCDAIITGSGD